MRPIFLLPLAAFVAVAAGCRSDAREQPARSVPERDLTLVTQAHEVAIASTVEMQQPKWAARPARARRTSREPTVRLAALVAPAPVLAALEPVAQPVSAASTSDNNRELLPGKTVTLIPASSGPSAGSDRVDDLPAVRGRTMVRCGGGGRRPGIGIGAAPRPDFR